MKTLLLSLLFLTVVATSRAAPGSVKVESQWTFDPKKGGVWMNKDTGIALRKSMGVFQLDSAEPMRKEGSSFFAYMGPRGTVTVNVEHRVAAGFPGSNDCTSAVRAKYLQVMHESYGKTDSEQSFRLRYASGDKQATGIGTLCHFVSFSSFGGHPAHSEVGVVLIGDFLLEYRASCIVKAGLPDLNAFLRLLGLRKT